MSNKAPYGATGFLRQANALSKQRVRRRDSLQYRNGNALSARVYDAPHRRFSPYRALLREVNTSEKLRARRTGST